MKKKRICMALAAALSLSLAVSATALAAIPSDIGGHWAQGTIIQWTTNGYISGYPDGTFKPDNSITRAEFVVMVNKAMGYNKRGNAYFSDVSAAHWAYAEIMKGVEAGYITGNGDGTFRPDAPVTRQEAAVMISKILGLDQDYASAAKYVDYRYIPSWAAGYVGAVSKAGIMTGYPDGDFKSDRVLTRAESVVSLDKTKNYDGKVEEDKDDREVFEDYRLTSSSLSDKIIKGDLIISSSLSNRNVSLDNVKVEGKLIVEGGKTVTADDCEISELEMNRSDVEFDATGRTKVGKTTFEKYGKLSGSGYSRVIIDEEFNSYIELDANIDYVELDADTNVRLLENCVIETFEATKNADNATVNFNKAEVDDMDIYDAIRITGRGDINNMTVYKSGVKSSIRPDHLDRRNGASKPDYTSTSSGDVGYNPGSRYDDLTVSRNNKIYKGGRYDDVKVTADERVTLKDMTIYGDLTIDEDVENGEVYLEDLDIRGKVYIYGGGQNTVSFKDCEIEGNIYAKKDYDNTPVGLYIDGDTVENFDGDLYIDDDGAILENGGKLDKVYVRTSKEVKVETNVKNLYVSAKTDNLTITSGTTVDKLSISSSSTITNKGTINELNTSQDITVNGNGTINNPTGDGTVTPGDDQKISVTGVKLNKSETTIKVGETETLTATIEPANATNKNITWSSTDDTVATVDGTGKVEAKKVGTATIKVTTADGNHVAECKVTVEENTVEVTGVSLDKTTLSLEEEGTATLKATVTPEDATDKTVTWTIGGTNSDAVTLNTTTGNEVTVTAAEEGTATITVTAGSFSDTCTVTVNPKTVAVTEVKLDETELKLEEGKTATLTATVTPDNATDKTVTWESSAPEYVSVTPSKTENGKATITANEAAEGQTVTITAKAGDETAICTVTVTAKTVEVTGVTIKVGDNASDTATMTAGGTLQLTAEVLPEGATEQGVTWYTSNDQVATVDKDGTVTAQNVNKSTEVTITATAQDESGKSDTITITVNPKVVENISLNPTTTTLTSVGQTAEIIATITPSDAVNGTVEWESSNNSVVSVTANQNENGKATVTAVSSGTATITATAGGKEATCEIKVEIPVESISITAAGVTGNSTTMTLDEGTNALQLQLTATVEPTEAKEKTVTWSITSDPNEAVTLSSSGNTATITAVSAGTATITASAGGRLAQFTITVQAASTSTHGTGETGDGDESGDQTGGDQTGGNQTGGDQTGGNQTGGNQTGGNQTGGDQTGGTQTGETTTQATNNAIVVSR